MRTIERRFSGSRLANARRQANLAREDVAYALRVTVTTVANWEQGRNAPHVDRLSDLAALLEIDVRNLFVEGDDA